LKKKLELGEKVVADNGYRGEPLHVNTPRATDDGHAQRVRARHDAVNKRFKHWEWLNRTFRHLPEQHESVFTAVAVITQLAIDFGEPLFSVNY
jgi:adenosyl cobinamide kinase/adenosyl cobinamide phosphate guanylyltransferase